MLAIHAQRLHFGQRLCGLGRRRTLGLHRLFIAILVNHRGDGFAIDTSIGQHGVAGLAAGCENKTMGAGHVFILLVQLNDRGGHTWSIK